MANLTGQTLGRYHILEQLGEGGMAVVYKAFDTRLERHVAIKVILPGKEHSEKFLKRFEREAKSLAQLSHPNIVKVIDYGEHDGLPYLVMEYLPGGTLKHKLSGKRMSWQDAVRLLTPIARALAYAHESKIIHRDIKPSNILITQSGEPMLSDFGIAKMLEAEETLDLTGTGVGVGTPEYMSPEQARGKDVDVRADVYSLGVVLYEMVTGRKPYQADTPMAVAFKLASEPLPRPRQFVPELPDYFEGVLIKALAKDPSRRIQNMENFVQTLNGLSQHMSKGKRRVPISVIAGVAFVIVAIFLARLWPKVAQPIFEGKDSASSPSVSNIALSKVNVPEKNQLTQTTIANIPSAVPDGASLLYYDQFGDPLYDGKFNQSLWIPRMSNCTVSQINGVLQFVNNASGSHQECDLYAGRPTMNLKANQLGTFQIQALISSDYNQKSVATKEIQFRTDNLSGGTWFALCGLKVEGTNTITGFMEISLYPKYQDYYNAISLEHGFDSWHTVRLEIDPTTLAVTCLVDNQLLGAFVPRDVKLLASADFMRVVEAARGPGAFATSYIDNVLFREKVEYPSGSTQIPSFKMLLNEDFTDPKFDGALDTDLWDVYGEIDSTKTRFIQHNGMLSGVLQPVDSHDYEFHSLQQWSFDEIHSAEWKVKLDNTVSGEWASLAVGFETTSGNRLTCDFRIHIGDSGLSCLFWKLGDNSPAQPLAIGRIPIRPSTWYTIRFEVVPQPLSVNLFLNDRKINNYLLNTEVWDGQQIHIYTSLGATHTQEALNVNIDNITVTGK